MQEWLEVEAIAQANRWDNKEAMDVYDVKEDTGAIFLRISCIEFLMFFSTAPGILDIQLELTEEEGTLGYPTGSTSWIASGLKIRDAQ